MFLIIAHQIQPIFRHKQSTTIVAITCALLHTKISELTLDKSCHQQEGESEKCPTWPKQSRDNEV